jgi:hypothetical protein
MFNFYACGLRDFFSLLQIRLNSMFLSKPCSLALPPDSPHRAADPQYEGIKRFMLTLLLFYSKQSKALRAANIVYDRITSQVDAPAIYDGKSSCFSAVLFVCFLLDADALHFCNWCLCLSLLF